MNWKPADIAMVKALGGGSESGGGGVTPNIQATAETLPPGSEATVTRTGSNVNPVFHFGIPEGKQGIQGPPGPQGPAGSGSDIIAGDGLSKEGDTLSVDNPVRGILTQAEFNALTKEQKASGTYFVDDGMTCAGECGDVYSTEERRIGTWIDGKPIYSKTFSGVTQKNTNAVVGFADISDLSIDTVVEINGVVNSDLGTGIVGLSCTRSDASLQLVGVSTDKKKLNVFVQSDSFTSKPFHCTLKYTKTTDQEVSA